MNADFNAATREAWDVRGWPGVLTLWVLVAADFARTVAEQWLRTGLPAVVVLSVTWSTMMCTPHRAAVRSARTAGRAAPSPQCR